MAIPSFDQHGFLPPEVYDCTLEEIKSRFGRFQENDRRPELFARLSAFVEEARSAQFARFLLIDGSFVTRTASPNDIDMVVVLGANQRSDGGFIAGAV